MNMVRIRHIIQMRRALKAPPLLPPKIKSRERSSGSVDKRFGPKNILVIDLNIRELKTELCTSSHIICLIYESAGGANGPWKLQTSSDVLEKSAEVDFPEAVAIEYAFEKCQYFKIEICDYAEEETSPIGAIKFSVSDVICSDSVFSAPIANEINGNTIGNITISCKPRPKEKQILLQFCGKNIPKKGMFDGAQVYFQIFRIEDDGERTFIYKSELLKYSMKITWRYFSLNFKTIADFSHRKLEVVCYWRGDCGKQLVIGQFVTTFNELQTASAQQQQLYLKKEKNEKRTCGAFEVSRCNEISVYSFLDYITAGSSLELSVVVDFSSPPHFSIDDKFIEETVFAIRTIGEQIKGYVKSNMFTAFGIGAKIPPQYRESHQFCLNLETGANCHSIDGIVDAFCGTCSHVQSTPTARFAHIIYYIAKMAENMRKREDISYSQYFVVLVITRGYIDDLKETVQAIIFASRAPISIVFVGIGEADFSKLERLGMAGCRLIYQNRRIDRDMMQFVNQTKIRNVEDLKLDDVKDAINEIALCQVPWQMAKWMMKNGVKPQRTSQQENDYEQQSGPSIASPMRYGMTAVKYDSIIGTFSDSDDIDRSPTTSSVFSTSFLERSFTSDFHTDVLALKLSDQSRSESLESYTGGLSSELQR